MLVRLVLVSFMSGEEVSGLFLQEKNEYYPIIKSFESPTTTKSDSKSVTPLESSATSPFESPTTTKSVVNSLESSATSPFDEFFLKKSDDSNDDSNDISTNKENAAVSTNKENAISVLEVVKENKNKVKYGVQTAMHDAVKHMEALGHQTGRTAAKTATSSNVSNSITRYNSSNPRKRLLRGRGRRDDHTTKDHTTKGSIIQEQSFTQQESSRTLRAQQVLVVESSQTGGGSWKDSAKSILGSITRNKDFDAIKGEATVTRFITSSYFAALTLSVGISSWYALMDEQISLWFFLLWFFSATQMWASYFIVMQSDPGFIYPNLQRPTSLNDEYLEEFANLITQQPPGEHIFPAAEKMINEKQEVINKVFGFSEGAFMFRQFDAEEAAEIGQEIKVERLKKVFFGMLQDQQTKQCPINNIWTLKLDHFCPFIYNCIGAHNHRPFIMFIGYLCIFFFVSLGITITPIGIKATIAGGGGGNNGGGNSESLSSYKKNVTFFGFVNLEMINGLAVMLSGIGMFFAFTMFAFTLQHISMVGSGQTTADSFSDDGAGAANYGHRLEHLFGIGGGYPLPSIWVLIPAAEWYFPRVESDWQELARRVTSFEIGGAFIPNSEKRSRPQRRDTLTATVEGEQEASKNLLNSRESLGLKRLIQWLFRTP